VDEGDGYTIYERSWLGRPSLIDPADPSAILYGGGKGGGKSLQAGGLTIDPAWKALAIRMVEQRTRRPNRRTRHKKRSFKSRDKKAGVYKCKACRLWHIGHNESL
jgi:hypothetical protein